MQFKDDGNLVISNQKTSLTVAYEEQDPNTLVIKASSDGSYPGQTMLYRIEEDRLILTWISRRLFLPKQNSQFNYLLKIIQAGSIDQEQHTNSANRDQDTQD